MRKRIKKRFDVAVPGSGSVVSQTFDLDKNIVLIHGLLLTSSRDDLMYYRGSQKIEINRDEIFPDGYESKLLMSGVNVSPDDRYYSLGGKEPGNFKVKIDYTDTDTPVIAFTPYRVSLYLNCEIEEV